MQSSRIVRNPGKSLAAATPETANDGWSYEVIRQEDLSQTSEELGDEISRVWPFVTVIMPIRNEAEFIVNSLGAVLSQDYPHDRMEVILADGMSTDDTRSLVWSLKSQGAPSIRLVDNHGLIVPTGLNAAISQARGEVVVVVGGHCEIERDYLRCCVEHLENDEVGGVGGPLETIGETAFARIVAAGMTSPFGVGGSAFRTVRGRTMFADTVAFPAYWRAVMDRAGPFDEELVRCQDDEYNYRLRKMGVKLLLAADTGVRYYSRSSLRALWRQYFQYGYWKVRVMQKHPLQMRPRQFIPPLFVTAILGSLLLAFFFPFGRILLVLVAGSYILSNLVASAWTASKSTWRHLLLLPVVFATLHLSYGLGVLQGLVRFWNRWGDKRTRYQTPHKASVQTSK